MKRSEMVDRIINFVYDATDCDVSITKEEASLILQFIEKTGMSPPKVVLKDPGHFPGDAFEYTIADWEEE